MGRFGHNRNVSEKTRVAVPAVVAVRYKNKHTRILNIGVLHVVVTEIIHNFL